MIVGTGEVFVQIPHRRAAERAMLAAQAATRRQRGCLAFSFAEIIDDPGHFVIVQRWSDQRVARSPLPLGQLRGLRDGDRTAARSATPTLELHVVQETVRPVALSNLDIRHDD